MRPGTPNRCARCLRKLKPEHAFVWLEKFYHHIFRSDTRAISMIREMGLEDRLEWKAPITATLRDGRMHQLDSPASTPLFSSGVTVYAGIGHTPRWEEGPRFASDIAAFIERLGHA